MLYHCLMESSSYKDHLCTKYECATSEDMTKVKVCDRQLHGHRNKFEHRSKLRNHYYTGSNDSERSDTKLEAPSFPIEYKIVCSTFYAKPYINRFRND